MLILRVGVMTSCRICVRIMRKLLTRLGCHPLYRLLTLHVRKMMLLHVARHLPIVVSGNTVILRIRLLMLIMVVMLLALICSQARLLNRWGLCSIIGINVVVS